mgnify:CR=1 FL=1
MPRNFEAAGWTNYEAQQFQAARAAYLAWFQDEPFSAEPAILAGYLSHLLDPTPSRAIDLTRMALAASPAEDLLLNNMAFYLAEAGQLDLAHPMRSPSVVPFPRSRAQLGPAAAGCNVRDLSTWPIPA